MRRILKKAAHTLARVLERAEDFRLPNELPIKTKLAFLTGTYEAETSRFIRSHVRGGIALDVGAHIGYYSRLLSPLVDVVYAFEPDPRNYALLKENTKRFKNIIPLNFAVSDESGEQPFFLVKNSTFRHSLIDEGGGERIAVKTVALDEMPELKDKRVSFVKIDVEGHEQSVLRGMTEVIAVSHPLIVAEMPLNDRYTPVSANIGGKRKVRNYLVS